MIRRLARLAICGGFAGSLVAINTSCAGLLLGTTPQQEAVVTSQPMPKRRMVQFSFGRDASFGVCTEPACPTVTPKTLAVAVSETSPQVSHRAAQEPSLRLPVSTAVVDASDVQVAPVRSVAPKAYSPEVATKHIVLSFSFASAQLTPESRALLSASIVNAKASERIVISGRTDNIGNQKVNETLAFARAMAVRDFIRDQVPDLPNIIVIDAKGRCCFIATNDDEGGRARNRRVEVAFTARGSV